MTDVFISTSKTELAERRKQLRWHRRLRFLKNLWQFSAIGCSAASLAWLMTLPGWVIRQPSQIRVEGNQFLSTESVYKLLPVSYPQSLLMIEPNALANKLKANGQIIEADVRRQLFPPRLTITIQERHPVAIASSTQIDDQLLKSQNFKSLAKSGRVHLLDEDGNQIAVESYTNLGKSVKLPGLKVIGLKGDRSPQWKELYSTIRESPVKVSEVDLRDPSNLKLKTELGTIQLGNYGSKLGLQLQAIDRLRKLPQQIKANQIAYIDVRNPDLPMLEMIKTGSSP